MMPKSISLILLPPPPSKITLKSISSAYRTPIKAALSVLKGLNVATELLVAVDWPVLHGRLLAPRTELFHDAQRLLGRLYGLIYIVSTELGIDGGLDLPDSTDAQIVLLDSSSNSITTQQLKPVHPIGPLIKLKDLAHSSQQWNQVFSVQNDEGQKLLAWYQYLRNQQDQEIIPHALHMNKNIPDSTSSISNCSNLTSYITHNVVAVGGTFDHIHAGHKLLLTATTLLLQRSPKSPCNLRMLVGITGDKLLKDKKYAEQIKSWEQRQENVMNFLSTILLLRCEARETSVKIILFGEPGLKNRAIHTIIDSYFTIECVEIQDTFGPTITDEAITALVVSSETRSGGNAVNQRRIENGLRQLDVYVVDVISSQDSDDDFNDYDLTSKISSTEIRKRKAENIFSSNSTNMHN